MNCIVSFCFIVSFAVLMSFGVDTSRMTQLNEQAPLPSIGVAFAEEE